MPIEQLIPYLAIILPIVANIALVAIGDRAPLLSYYIGKLFPAIVAAIKSPREARLEVLLDAAEQELKAVAAGESPLSARIAQEIGARK